MQRHAALFYIGETMNLKYDAVIIGGGASGLMCAIAAKRKNQNLKVAVIEKNDRVGKKLLSTGNGRCNLTNMNVRADKYIGSFQKQSASIFEKYDAEALLGYFNELGLVTCADSEGRVYPLCRQATSVLDVLRFQCENLGVDIFCAQTVKSIKHSNTFTVTTAEHSFTSDKLVIAAGSKAAPKLGGNGSCADYLKNLGHSFVPFSPALCPVIVNSDVLKSLKGLRANAEVRLIRDGKNIKAERGEIQFNEDNLSGICVFDLSLYSKSGDEISLDLTPDISTEELCIFLSKNKIRFANQTADNILTGVLQKRLSQAVMKQAGVKGFNSLCSDLSDNTIRNIANAAKHMSFTVTDNGGFDRAQACKGGVMGSEIDEATMQSRICNNLYVCGEAIDLCGECGGYNLHFAFASGIIAGESL